MTAAANRDTNPPTLRRHPGAKTHANGALDRAIRMPAVHVNSGITP